MVTAVQAGASTLINLTVGSVLRAIIEAVAGVILWLQGLIIFVATLTRAATSWGGDLDSWMADYGFKRLAATASAGQVTFARFTATAQAVVPVGSIVQTGDGTQSFTVTVDTTNAAYNATIVTGGGYVLASGVSSISAPVQAVNAGTQGNVHSGSITSLAQSISGVDTVTNAAAFANGIDTETDTAFRARFVLYIASLSKATKIAIGAAIANVQQGLQYTLTENYDYSGTLDYGFFYVVIDDGTGYPSSALQASVGSAIEAVRGLTSRFAVFAPVVVTATPTMVLTTAAGYTHATVVAQVTAALQAFINGLALGASLPYTQLAAIAYGVAGVTNVSGVLLNGGAADLTATPKQAIICGTPVVS